MNSNYGKGSSGSMNNFNFDFGLGSTRPKSLNDPKSQTSSLSSAYTYTSYSSTSTTTTTTGKPTWQQPNKPSWTHQPAPTGLNGPTSMVGDIFGKSWNSTGSGSGVGIGIGDKNPNLFGDLVNSAMGEQGNKSMGSNSNVPLKDSTPTSNKSAYSMGNLADSLPKTSNSAKNAASWGSNDSFGSFSSGYNKNSSNVNAGVSNNNSENLGGPSMKSMSGGGSGGVMSGNKDPFGSLVDFVSKQQTGSLNSGSKGNKGRAGGDDVFGDFQNATKSGATAFPSSGFDAKNNDFMGSNMGSNSNMDDFGMPNNIFASQEQPPVQSSGGDPLDMFFPSPSGGAGIVSGGGGGQQFSEVDDWGLDSDFGGGGGNDAGSATTELEGLPPPPAGLTASTAKNKGIDHQKQGQYADAIKWLSWAVVLLKKTDNKDSAMEVLTCRASCYKEVGEYKKAVADCSQVLEDDAANVSVLVQRALLYESMEKYKLGAEDLRTVLKLDPANRIARSTIHRLTKMAD